MNLYFRFSVKLILFHQIYLNKKVISISTNSSAAEAYFQ